MDEKQLVAIPVELAREVQALLLKATHSFPVELVLEKTRQLEVAIREALAPRPGPGQSPADPPA